MTYTVIEAAEALGRSIVNFRRWINNDLIPAPFLREQESSRKLFCYCTEELQLIARYLAQHERDYSYFGEKHETVIHQIAQAIHGYRDMTFGESNEPTNPAARSSETATRRPRRTNTRP